MSTPTWTDSELAEFDKLVTKLNSRDQMDRIEGRMDMHAFTRQHGKEKCQAMFNHLESEGKK